MDELMKQLAELQAQIKSQNEKAAEQIKSYGTILEETKKSLTDLQGQVDAIDKKMADRHVGDVEQPSLEETLKSNDSVERLLKGRRGVATIQLTGAQAKSLMERKTTITSTAVGAMTSGVLQIDRTPGIVAEARQALRVRNLLSARPTAFQVIDFVKVNSPMGIASPQTEANDKAENAVTFTTHSEKVRTIATWIPATRQILDDMTELASFISSTLPYYVDLEEELQLLSGDGTGENLNGLITQSADFSASLLDASAGWNKIDIIGRAIQQITAAKELDPTFVVVNPNDWWDIRLTKDQFGRYILGDPQTNVAASLFGLTVVPTTSMASGSFLVGSGNSVASEIRDRMEMQVEVSTEHADYFTKNLVAVRAEKRVALVVKRPNSYVNGSFSTSPA
jgi:HK97 family phage major capsid protein